MTPEIKIISKKLVVGLQSEMVHNDYGKIVDLWKCFMPNRDKIENRVSSELIALQDYSDFKSIDKPYDIWACVEVAEVNNLQDSMSSFEIPKGQYAVFHYKGMNASALYRKIMTEWLPNSDFEIDNRPHFQIMGKNYKNGSPDSEEDFYVPIRSRSKN